MMIHCHQLCGKHRIRTIKETGPPESDQQQFRSGPRQKSTQRKKRWKKTPGYKQRSKNRASIISLDKWLVWEIISIVDQYSLKESFLFFQKIPLFPHILTIFETWIRNFPELIE